MIKLLDFRGSGRMCERGTADSINEALNCTLRPTNQEILQEAKLASSVNTLAYRLIMHAGTHMYPGCINLVHSELLNITTLHALSFGYHHSTKESTSTASAICYSLSTVYLYSSLLLIVGDQILTITELCAKEVKNKGEQNDCDRQLDILKTLYGGIWVAICDEHSRSKNIIPASWIHKNSRILIGKTQQDLIALQKDIEKAGNPKKYGYMKVPAIAVWHDITKEMTTHISAVFVMYYHVCFPTYLANRVIDEKHSVKCFLNAIDSMYNLYLHRTLDMDSCIETVRNGEKIHRTVLDHIDEMRRKISTMASHVRTAYTQTLDKLARDYSAVSSRYRGASDAVFLVLFA